MPVSPNSRGGEEKRATSNNAAPQQSPEPDSSTVGNTHSAPQNLSKSQRRNLRQRLRERLARVREDAQLAGAIETTPEGAVRNERVRPDQQSEQEQPKLIETAIKKGWAVPEDEKPELVTELVTMVKQSESEKNKVAAFRALLAADQAQHERDNPQTKNNKSTVNVSVQTNIAAVDVLRQSMRQVNTTPPQDIPQIEE